ncbi:hypothetical protein A2961_01915 [Candidatus Woesebacteria bacterium RIFCSPLOWO2_01_FULL_39_21]|uniref:Peptidase M16 n=1 Tax=Candidatus Woesebacteria bacterium RIFCSPLOWO2_01_FULL_39_21 TaxID=1802519 RepID=A0A1F8BEG8_9BACT|nr:MAG: hypothetical protein A2691_01500 [Candidatus Woesebacteria bacterium RIFCSPHIGHO2_01_FULL_39_23]OGM62444.1 MAG: hypothetical protein A2961_01915 [Candidatus Woesebacteria bacterium RIFCSPLOWO2_01_FULL_39_21]
MKYQVTKLANGLRVMTIPVPGVESATVAVWVGSGSRNDPRNLSGISHFLEHMAFKGTKKRKTAREITELIDEIGGEFNASTSKEWINFYIKARKQSLELLFDVLSDLVLNPIFNEKELEKEKGVILEEISLHKDNPYIKIGDFFENTIFEGHSLEKDITGNRKSVKKFKRADLLRYVKEHFYASGMLISVAGGIRTSESEVLAKKYFGELPARRVETKIDKFKVRQESPRVRLLKKKSDQAHVSFGYYSKGRGSKLKFTEAVLLAILGRGASSRLYYEIREKRALAYAIGSSVERYIDIGYFETYMGVDPKRIDEALKILQDQIYGLSSEVYPISQKELKKAKEYIKGRLALSLEDTKDVNYFMSEGYLFGIKPETPEEVYKKIDGVTVAQVLKIAKNIFDPKRANLAIIGPFKDENRFDKLLA